MEKNRNSLAWRRNAGFYFVETFERTSLSGSCVVFQGPLPSPSHSLLIYIYTSRWVYTCRWVPVADSAAQEIFCSRRAARGSQWATGRRAGSEKRRRRREAVKRRDTVRNPRAHCGGNRGRERSHRSTHFKHCSRPFIKYSVPVLVALILKI